MTATRAAAMAAVLAAAACAQERVEYRRRPDYAQGSDVPAEFVAKDGTRVVFVDGPKEPKTIGAAPLAPPEGADGSRGMVFQQREELDDGTVVLRNIFPDHVVGNAMTCIRREEYRLMWDQLLAPDARERWDRAGGYDAFESWFRANRPQAMELLNRMRFNAVGSDVAMKQVEPGVMRATLAPHLWDQFKLRVVEFEQTTDGMKLRSIRAEP